METSAESTRPSPLADNEAAAAAPAGLVVALVGHPNVGKSVLFHRLTGTYVNVSNYPGTTVEVSRATLKIHKEQQVLDTPGVLSLPSRSDDERATLRALLQENLNCLVQVGDAKNLRRTLTLTALLADLGVPMVLMLNMADEAEQRGIGVDDKLLAEALGIPVISGVATRNEGVGALEAALAKAARPEPLLCYDDAVESAIGRLAAQFASDVPHAHLSARGLAILYLGHDPELEAWLDQHFPKTAVLLAALRLNLEGEFTGQPLAAILSGERGRAAEALTRTVAREGKKPASGKPLTAGQLAVHPVWGWPILLGVLFLLYEFVGVFGASTLVGLFEEDFFGGVLNPAFTELVQNHVSIPWIVELLVGEYGLWTMGMTYALALILPIVTTFFFAFGILEDSGYLPRLTVIANRTFAAIGLNGKAVLPMVLGLGCVTMATLTTRILATPRERLITTFLLALAIPCSAQLGVVLGLLGGVSFGALLTWAVCILVVMLASGWLASRLIPGKRIPLMTELPPLRWPVLGNVLKKTGGRLKWYLVEVIPLFLIGTFLMFALDKIGALPAIIEAGEPLVSGWLGLPKEASAAFVMGFLRRDFGATGLFAMTEHLSAIQAVVGMVTITLFVPCIASVMMIVKEQGLKVAVVLLALIIPTAFLIGGILNHLLRLFA